MTMVLRIPKAAGVEASGIGRVAVIGAGSMGAGIAAQFANAGIPVDLLDIPGPDSASRNAPAKTGIERQIKAGGFMQLDAAGLVRPGNVDDDLQRIADADWIVEAVIEKLDVKRDLYRRIDAVRKKSSIVSSNTSTIPRRDLVNGLGQAFAADFLITHFFNPPRVMRLVEIVSAPENDAGLLRRARLASETILGKTVVDCRDTPGFIANRIGCYWLAVAVIEAQRLGLTADEADAVMAALGTPRTGAFGLLDLVGIDLVPHVWGSLMSSLPADDPIHAQDLPGDRLIKSMIAAGQFGRKAKAGFYRLAADKSRETLDFATGDYKRQPPFDPSILPGRGRDLRTLLNSDDRFGRYAWNTLSRVVTYAAEMGAQIAADVGSIDVAIQLGYAWKDGPFALADRYGTKAFADRLVRDGLTVPPLLARAAAQQAFFDTTGAALRTAGEGRAESLSVSLLSKAKLGGKAISQNEAASLWDIGDGLACFEMHTKMNSFAAGVFDLLDETLARGARNFRGLVIANDDPRAFSVGADLSFIADLIRKKSWSVLERYVARGQEIFLRLKYADFPVVAAVHGFALGGGCEFMLHASAVVAHAELNAGLPEAKVGLIPAWGGCTELLLRAQQSLTGPKGPAATANAAFATIFAAATSTSASDARSRGLLRLNDTIAMNRNQLMQLAKDRALAMVGLGYQAPEPALLTMSGRSGKLGIMNGVEARLAAGLLSEHDVRIADALASVLTGGPSGDPRRVVTEADMMVLELAALMQLVQAPETRQRIEHMLQTGKPLRN